MSNQPMLHSSEEIGAFMQGLVKDAPKESLSLYIDGGIPYRKLKEIDPFWTSSKRPEPSMPEGSHSRWLTFAAICATLEIIAWIFAIVQHLVKVAR